MGEAQSQRSAPDGVSVQRFKAVMYVVQGDEQPEQKNVIGRR